MKQKEKENRKKKQRQQKTNPNTGFSTQMYQDQFSISWVRNFQSSLPTPIYFGVAGKGSYITGVVGSNRQLTIYLLSNQSHGMSEKEDNLSELLVYC